MSFAKSIIEKYLSGLAEGAAPDADELDALIDEEQPKHVVPKQKYLDAQSTIKQNAADITTLQSQVEEGSEAAKTIEQLQADIAERDRKDAKAAADARFNEAAKKFGATNARLVKLALIEDGVNLEEVDEDVLELKIEKIKADEDFKSLFAADDEDEDEQPNNVSEATGTKGYRVLDNGIKGTKGNKAKEEDAIASRLAAAMGTDKY